MAATDQPVLVFIDGLPIVPQPSRPTLERFVIRKVGDRTFDSATKTYMPVDQHGMTTGVAIVRFNANEQAQQCVTELNNTAVDRNHTISVARVEDSDMFRQLQSQGVIDTARVDALRSIERSGPLDTAVTR